MRRVDVVGARVRVAIAAPSAWALGAADALNGMVGEVEKVQSAEAMTGHPLRVPRMLVRFDTPAPTWHSYQQPVRSFWFDEYELEAL